MTSSTVDFRQERIKFNLDLVEQYRVLLGQAVPLPDYETCKLAIEQILTNKGSMYRSAPSMVETFQRNQCVTLPRIQKG